MCRKMKLLRRHISLWVVTFLLTLLVSQGQMWPQNFAGTNVYSPTIGDNRLPNGPHDVAVPSSPRPMVAIWPKSVPRPAPWPSPRATARPPPGMPTPTHRDAALMEPWPRAVEDMRRPTPVVSRAVQVSSRQGKFPDKGLSTTTTMNRTSRYGRNQQDPVNEYVRLISSTMELAAQRDEAVSRPPAPGGWNAATRPESRIREKPDNVRPNKTEPTHRGNTPLPIVSNGKRADRPAFYKPSKTSRLPDSTLIVFPGETVSPTHYIPAVACANNSLTFCESTPDYPADHLARLLNSELATRFGTLFGADEVDATNISHRLGPDSDLTLCQSTERVIYPTSGQTREDQWRFIVNQEKFLQGVRIEMCDFENNDCKFGDSFPLGYRSYCKQKYIYRKLVSLKEDGSTTTEDFKLPACCACHVTADMTSMRVMTSDIKP